MYSEAALGPLGCESNLGQPGPEASMLNIVLCFPLEVYCFMGDEADHEYVPQPFFELNLLDLENGIL